MASKDLTPAYGDLHTAVLMMAIRYAQAHADWAVSLHAGSRALERSRLRRAEDRRYKAMGRLLWALERPVKTYP